MTKARIEIRPRLRVIAGRNVALGPGKAELLELVQKHGSITKAAREMKMSYMRAWTLIQMMNRCFKTPVVVTQHGGARGGGGATLTETGRKALELYKTMDAQCLKAVAPTRKRLEQ